jgi:hypothetical protein
MFTFSVIVEKELYTGDYGMNLFGKVNTDISDVTGIKFRFTLPDGTRVDKTGSFNTDGHDGLVKYIIESGFLEDTGNYGLQLELTFTSAKYYTESEYFYVNENIEDI